MKFINKIFLLLLICSFTISLNANNLNKLNLTQKEKEYLKNNSTIKVHNESDWAPYNYNVSGRASGFSIEYIKLISSKVGLKIDFISGYTWSQFMDMIKKNQIDVMLNIAKTKEREEFLSFTSPYTKIVDSIVIKRDRYDLNKIEDFNGKTLAVVNGFYEEYLLRNLYPNISLLVCDTTQEALKSVAFKKADGAINSFSVINYLINKYSLTNIEPKFEVDDKRFNLDLHIATNKNNKILRDILEKAKSLLTQAEIIHLRASWLGSIDTKVELTSSEKEFIQKHPKIVLGSDSRWEPFVTKNSDGSISGYDVDILNKINKLTGANFTLTLGNWANIQRKAQIDEIDGLSTIKELEERKKWFNFSNSYISVKHMVVVKSGNPMEIYSKKDLVGKNVAVQRSNLNDISVVKNFKDLNILYYDNAIQMAQSILSGKADFYFGNSASLNLANKAGLPFFEFAFTLDNNIELSFAVKKDWKEAISILNKGLAKISVTERNAIKDKWFEDTDIENHNIIFNSVQKKYIKNKKEIKICVDPDWLPFEKIEDGKYIGLGAKYVKIFSDRIGLPFTLIPTKSWKETLNNLEQRKCDILPLASSVTSRKEYADFSKPYLKIPIVVATKIGVPFIDNIKQILTKEIAVVKDYALIERLKKQYPSIKIVEVDSTLEGLKKVESGELYCYLDNYIVINRQIQDKFIGTVTISGKLSMKENLSVAIRNDEPILNEIFEKVLLTIDSVKQKELFNQQMHLHHKNVEDYSMVLKTIAIFSIIIIIILFWYRKLSVLNNQLEKEKYKAQKATQFKSEFLANMSHEIRTPMNGIIGMNHLSLELSQDDKQKNYLNKVDQSAKILLNIINDILDISKIEAGKLTIEKSNFDMDEIITYIKNSVELKAKEKKLELNINYNEKESIYYGDSLRISQVLLNLITNAIKFTKKGSVELIIIPSTNNHLKFIVRDTGIGISIDKQDTLFDCFSQGDGTITRDYGGSGLGLSISKKLIELMDGKLWFKSEVDIGSEFIFEIELPLGDVKKIKNINCIKNKDNLKTKIKTLKGSKILLVEDNIINQELIINLLVPSGIEIDLAQNGEEAVDKYEKNKDKYELILMDLQMPIIDGITATKLIREYDLEIPIIALTANAMTEHKELTKDAKMDDHLTKPINIENFYNTLLKYISKKVDIDKISESKDKIVENLIIPEFKNIDISVGLESLLDNKELYLKLLNTFYTDYKNIDFESLNPDKFKRIIHTIKGISGTIGAINLHEVAKELDKSQDKTILPEFHKQLNNVLNELKDIKKDIESLLDIDTLKIDELYETLRIAVKSHRPHKCNPIIENMLQYKLSKIDIIKIEKIKIFIKNYEFENAQELL